VGAVSGIGQQLGYALGYSSAIDKIILLEGSDTLDVDIPHEGVAVAKAEVERP